VDSLALGTTSDLLGYLFEEGERGFFFRWIKMNYNIRYEYRLEGISNYLQWKVRITSFFKENELCSFVDNVVPTFILKAGEYKV